MAYIKVKRLQLAIIEIIFDAIETPFFYLYVKFEKQFFFRKKDWFEKIFYFYGLNLLIMKKIYASCMALSLGFCLAANAQAPKQFYDAVKAPKHKLPTIQALEPGLEICNFVNEELLNEPASDSLYYFTYGANGYIMGTNNADNTEHAGFFDVTGQDGDYISEAYYYFVFANSSRPANLEKEVYYVVYDGSDDVPGDELARATTTLGAINEEWNQDLLSYVEFSPSIEIPASRKFFVSFDVINLTWAAAAGRDSLCVLGSYHITDLFAPNCWLKSAGTWEAGADHWVSSSTGEPLESTVTIFPSLSCGSLPVKLVSFYTEQKNKDVVLHWNTANETDMKNYEIQRSLNGVDFSTISTVNALGYTSASYSTTDKNAFAFSNKVFYRIKQVNQDMKHKYSNIVVVKQGTGNLNVTVVNPMHNTLQMQVNTNIAQKATIKIYDMKGQFTGIQTIVGLNAGSQTISVDKVASLPQGMYMVDMLVGGAHTHYKVIKN